LTGADRASIYYLICQRFGRITLNILRCYPVNSRRIGRRHLKTRVIWKIKRRETFAVYQERGDFLLHLFKDGTYKEYRDNELKGNGIWKRIGKSIIFNGKDKDGSEKMMAYKLEDDDKTLADCNGCDVLEKVE
jgi:hypothetical protein